MSVTTTTRTSKQSAQQNVKILFYLSKTQDQEHEHKLTAHNHTNVIWRRKVNRTTWHVVNVL